MLASSRFAALTMAAAFALAGCGAESRETSPGAAGDAETTAEADVGMQHGLGVSEDTLYIATHTGLWSAPEGQTKAVPFGDSRQDVMGFSVLDEDRFIGSGHPEPTGNQPPNLGLIESRDGGRRWENVSLLGEADFHVLESSRSRIYGYDGTQGRLMVSADDGRTWQPQVPPAGIYSLAIDPESDERFIASTEQGLFSSDDGGRRLRPVALRDQRAGLLAWPAPDRLSLIDGSGRVFLSADRGSTWEPVGDIEGQPAAFIADGKDLFAATTAGIVKRSTDDGRSWIVRATP